MLIHSWLSACPRKCKSSRDRRQAIEALELRAAPGEMDFASLGMFMMPEVLGGTVETGMKTIREQETDPRKESTEAATPPRSGDTQTKNLRNGKNKTLHKSPSISNQKQSERRWAISPSTTMMFNSCTGYSPILRDLVRVLRRFFVSSWFNSGNLFPCPPNPSPILSLTSKRSATAI